MNIYAAALGAGAGAYSCSGMVRMAGISEAGVNISPLVMDKEFSASDVRSEINAKINSELKGW